MGWFGIIGLIHALKHKQLQAVNMHLTQNVNNNNKNPTSTSEMTYIVSGGALNNTHSLTNNNIRRVTTLQTEKNSRLSRQNCRQYV